jgi:hypothetical protein
MEVTMSMSKKDFIELADMIKDRFPKLGQFGPSQIGLLADFCKRQNPRFNRERWLDYLEGKCGPSGGRVK